MKPQASARSSRRPWPLHDTPGAQRATRSPRQAPTLSRVRQNAQKVLERIRKALVEQITVAFQAIQAQEVRETLRDLRPTRTAVVENAIALQLGPDRHQGVEI